MNKTNLFVFCSIGFLASSATALAADKGIEEVMAKKCPENSSPSRKNNLKEWCILPEGLGRTEGPRDIPDHAIRPAVAKYPCKKEIWVRSGKRCVAIIRVELDGRLMLNPEGKGFDYGPIPALRDMTQLQADELWGTETKSLQGDVVTYKLTSYQSRNDLFIDVIFRDDRICRYKVRSDLIEQSNWNNVE